MVTLQGDPGHLRLSETAETLEEDMDGAEHRCSGMFGKGTGDVGAWRHYE